MSDWIIWLIIVAAMASASLLYRYWKKRKAQRIKSDFDNGVAKINREIESKVKRDTAAGLKRSEEIKAQAMANSTKEQNETN